MFPTVRTSSFSPRGFLECFEGLGELVVECFGEAQDLPNALE